MTARVIAASGDIFVNAVNPVIVQSKPGEFQQMLADIRPLQLTNVLDVGPGVLRRLNIGTTLSQPWRGVAFTAARSIPLFNMHASVFDGWTLASVAENSHVQAIYEDRPLKILQFPVAPPEGTFSVRTPSGPMYFTSTQWTRRLIGADAANAAGFSGQGINAVVVDTGGNRANMQLARMVKSTVLPGNRVDVIGHGCIEGDAYIHTTLCGVARMQDIYERGKSKWGEVQSELGYTVRVPDEHYTVGFDVASGQTVKSRVLAIHKIPYRGKVIRVLASGKRSYLTTPWHPFLLGDRRRGTYRYVRADKLPYYCGLKDGKRNMNYFLVTPSEWEGLPAQDAGFNIIENYLIGLYIAEGFLSSIQRFKKNKKYVQPTPRLLYSLSDGEVPVFRQFLSRTGYGSSMHGSGVVQLFNNVFVKKLVGLGFQVNGRKATTVKIPEILLKQGRRELLALIAGIIDGDGCITKKTSQIRISTASKDLAGQLVTLLTTLGYRTTMRLDAQPGFHHFPGSKGGTRYINAIWHVVIHGMSSHRLIGDIAEFMVLHPDRKPAALSSRGWKGKKDHVWIHGVEEEDFDGYLYDLTTSTGNYAAGKSGVAFIHNTWCASCLGGTLVKDQLFSAETGVPVYCEGMAPQCNLFQVKALDYVIGTGMTSQLIAGLEEAYRLGADVISCSWGGPTNVSQPQDSPFYTVMETLDRAGVIVCVAAGNSGPQSSTIADPGSMPQPITVGSWNVVSNTSNSMFGEAGEVSGFSSRGPTPWGDIKPDVVAPGAIIDSGAAGLYPTEMSASYTHRVHQQSAIAGSSMATPHVAGLLTCMRQAHRQLLGKMLTNSEVKAMMTALGTQKNNASGWGPITWSIYTRWLSTEYGVQI